MTIKKIFLLLVIGTGISAGAMAQSNSVKTDQRILKNTVADKKEDKHEVGNNLQHLRVKSAMRGHREVKRHRRSIHKQGENLERRGVAHPVEHAKKQVKAEKDMKKGKD
jgi:hypothetical protein